MNTNIENQIKELVKGMEKPLDELATYIDLCDSLQIQLEEYCRTREHYNAVLYELEAFKEDRTYYQGLIYDIIQQVIDIADDVTVVNKVYDDPIAYFTHYIKIPTYVDNIFNNIV